MFLSAAIFKNRFLWYSFLICFTLTCFDVITTEWHYVKKKKNPNIAQSKNFSVKRLLTNNFHMLQS